MRKGFGILLFAAVCALLAVIFLWKAPQTVASTENTLVKAFDTSGARMISSEIYFSGRVSNSKKSFNEQKLFIEQLAGEMGVLKNDSFQSREVRTDTIEKIQVTGVTDKGRTVEINLQRTDKSNTEGRIITVSIMDYIEVSDLEETKKAALRVLDSFGIHPESNSCIIGSFEGKFDDEKMNSLCNRILQTAEAKKLSTISDRNLISVSAYSHFIEDSINLQGKKMNLNVAIRYNSIENRTYVWLASPVIAVEY